MNLATAIAILTNQAGWIIELQPDIPQDYQLRYKAVTGHYKNVMDNIHEQGLINLAQSYLKDRDNYNTNKNKWW